MAHSLVGKQHTAQHLGMNIQHTRSHVEATVVGGQPGLEFTNCNADHSTATYTALPNRQHLHQHYTHVTSQIYNFYIPVTVT